MTSVVDCLLFIDMNKAAMDFQKHAIWKHLLEVGLYIMCVRNSVSVCYTRFFFRNWNELLMITTRVLELRATRLHLQPVDHIHLIGHAISAAIIKNIALTVTQMRRLGYYR